MAVATWNWSTKYHNSSRNTATSWVCIHMQYAWNFTCPSAVDLFHRRLYPSDIFHQTGPTTQPPNHKGPKIPNKQAIYLIYRSSIPHFKHHIDNFMETVSAPILFVTSPSGWGIYIIYCTRLNSDHISKIPPRIKIQTSSKTTKQPYMESKPNMLQIAQCCHPLELSCVFDTHPWT